MYIKVNPTTAKRTNKAINAVNDLRGRVDTSKNQLYLDNRNAADPGSAISSAATAAGSLQPDIPDSPLANTFSDFVTNLGNTSAVSNYNRNNNNYGVQSYNNSGNSGVSYY